MASVKVPSESARNNPSSDVKRKDPRAKSQSTAPQALNEDELNRLISGISAKTARPRAPKQAPKGQRPAARYWPLALVVLLLLCAAGYMAYSFYDAQRPAPPPPQDPEAKPVEQAAQGEVRGDVSHGGSTYVSNTAGASASSAPITEGNLIIPNGGGLASADIVDDGWHYGPVSQLTLPANGAPLKVHCLLRAELDPYTFSRWQQMGIINSADYIVKFKPVLTIKDQAALDMLYDWHVEAVAPEQSR